MGRKPLPPGRRKSKHLAVRLSFQEQVLIEQIAALFDMSYSEILRMALKPITASPQAPTTIEELEARLTAAAFQAQCREMESEQEAIILTQIAKDLDNPPPGQTCTGPGCPLHGQGV
jgi:transposase-like protein